MRQGSSASGHGGPFVSCRRAPCAASTNCNSLTQGVRYLGCWRAATPLTRIAWPVMWSGLSTSRNETGWLQRSRRAAQLGATPTKGSESGTRLSPTLRFISSPRLPSRPCRQRVARAPLQRAHAAPGTVRAPPSLTLLRTWSGGGPPALPHHCLNKRCPHNVLGSEVPHYLLCREFRVPLPCRAYSYPRSSPAIKAHRICFCAGLCLTAAK